MLKAWGKSWTECGKNGQPIRRTMIVILAQNKEDSDASL